MKKFDHIDKSHSKRCEECGDKFFRDKRCTRSYWSAARFCSRKCVGLAKTKRAERKRQPRGSEIYCAKLTEKSVAEIRQDQGTVSEISERYGVSVASIRLIRAGKTWRHV